MTLEIYSRRYEERRNSSDWLELYYENPMDLTLRKRHEMLFRGSNRQKLREETMESIELLGTISEINKMYDRGLGLWLKILFNVAMIGFLLYIIWSLLSWRPPMP